MTGIDPPEGNLRIMRVNTTQDQTEAQLIHNPAHPFAEESRARTEVVGRWHGVDSSIDIVDLGLHSMNLLPEHGVAQRSRRLVFHGMVAKLVVAADEVLQGSLAAGYLGPNYKEGCSCFVGFEDLEDVLCVFGRRIINCKGYAFLIGRYVP